MRLPGLLRIQNLETRGCGSFCTDIHTLPDSRLPDQMKGNHHEDMHADIYTEFGRVLRFLGVEPDLVAMQSAIDGASFDRMKLLEERERADEEYGTVFQVHPRQSQGNARFMNRGKVGQSLGDISSELDSLFDEVFADHLQTYGYA